MGRTLLLVVLAVWVACTGRAWADAGICANCHFPETALQQGPGGHTHGQLQCVACHDDLRPGRVGRRHRSIPRCKRCHEEGAHPPKKKGVGHGMRSCLKCHDAHGSSNAQLIRPELRARGRFHLIDFQDAGGAVPGGFVSPDASGTGLCEVCHRRTDFWRANGRGQPHYTAQCTLCHAHDAGFAVQITDGSCVVCHTAEAQRFTLPSAHSQRFACVGCHDALAPQPGPGHRAIPACTTCHSQATHAPNGAGFPCTTCHNPHGTTNADLVLEAIKTPAGEAHTIVFTSDAGRADGSFASASAPGTGVCEICHASTTFYRADGTGLPHFTGNCLSCHPHAQGFEAQITPQSCPVCHVPEADRFALPSQHSARFQCVDCHAEVSPRAGPGHRSIPACTTCHDQATHSPNGSDLPCTTCHNPHGTTNTQLVLEAITSPAGGAPHPIVFNNIDGLAEGSFASPSAPGTGVCEICHTTTLFYRADGTGAPHFTISCLPCHRHSQGFAPPPPSP